MSTYNVGNSKNILVGAAAFFVAPSGTVAPTLTAGAAAKDAYAGATGWSNPGYTENGVEVSYEPTYGDVTVDQLLDSALIFKSGMKVMVNTTFAEATLENLLIVWGQADSDLDTDTLQIQGGSLGDYPHERALAFVGPGPRTTTASERVYSVSRAIQTQSTNHALKRDAATTLPVSFRCLPGSVAADGTVTGTAYGTVVDRALS